MSQIDDKENFQNISDYTVIDIIGTGSFGTCYKVKRKSTDDYYVWKAVDYGAMALHEKQLLVTEVNLMSTLRHPNVVHYYGRIIHKSSGTLYIIMEWCQCGDLSSLINTCRLNQNYVEEKFVWKVLFQTAKALEACHSLLHQVTVLHRDIKPANIFLDENYNVKLGDFGLAKILQKNVNFSSTVVGTPYYMSPEQIRGMKYNKKSDVWSLGCLLYELCSLHQPFNGNDMDELRKNIACNRLARIPDIYSDQLDKIIKLLLNSDYEHRPSVEMIVHHPTVICNYDKNALPFNATHTKHESKATKQKETFSSNENMKRRMSRSIHVKKEKRNSVTYQFDEPKRRDFSPLHSDPKEITEEVYNEKLISRLKLLRVKETALKAKEDSLLHRERFLKTKECTLVQKQQQIEKREREIAELQRNNSKEFNENPQNRANCKTLKTYQRYSKKQKSNSDLDSTTCSGDLGNTILVSTVSKLDPSKIIRPSFFNTNHRDKIDQPSQQINCRHPFTFLQNNLISENEKHKSCGTLKKYRQLMFKKR